MRVEALDSVTAAFAGLPAPEVLQLNVTSEDDWSRVLGEVVARAGSLDVLVNAAGVVGSAPYPIDGLPEAEWRRLISPMRLRFLLRTKPN